MRGARRRAIGLRREEVSEAAGISVTWYTWLEQGREVHVSPRALNAIADALRLDATERAHLLRLADAAHGTSATALTHAASDSLGRWVDSLVPHPAYAVNGMWDVLHENSAATTLLGRFGASRARTNVLTRLFLDPEWRSLFDQWETVATFAVAQFRAATAKLSADREWQSFIDRLVSESEDFAGMWARHDLAVSSSRSKTLHHPTLGTVDALYASLVPDAEPADVRVIVYTIGPRRS